MENKWQVQECGEESYAITNGKITIVTSDADNESHLQAIADLLNSSGYRFHSENKLELDLHLEAEAAKMELTDVKAKCERYEALMQRFKHLKSLWMYYGEVKPEHEGEAQVLQILSSELDEALSAGEGKKEVITEASLLSLGRRR